MGERARPMFPVKYYFFVASIALFSGGWLVLANRTREDIDIVGALINPNFSVLFSQSVLLIFMIKQVLVYCPISILVGVRQQAEYIQVRLLKVLVFETFLYFLIYYGVFFLCGVPIFQNGPVVIGIFLLLLRFLMVLVLAIMIVAAYRFRSAGILAILALLANLAYHYYVELQWLLIVYSPVYDPVWQAMHRK